MIWGGCRVETCVSSRGKNVSHLWLKVWRVFWRILWMVSGVHWFEHTVEGRRSWIIASLPSVLDNFWEVALPIWKCRRKPQLYGSGVLQKGQNTDGSIRDLVF
jgi:hypothetical protein